MNNLTDRIVRQEKPISLESPDIPIRPFVWIVKHDPEKERQKRRPRVLDIITGMVPLLPYDGIVTYLTSPVNT